MPTLTVVARAREQEEGKGEARARSGRMMTLTLTDSVWASASACDIHRCRYTCLKLLGQWLCIAQPCGFLACILSMRVCMLPVSRFILIPLFLGLMLLNNLLIGMVGMTAGTVQRFCKLRCKVCALHLVVSPMSCSAKQT
jgi:hypothetical protein